jgi:hypothetical protein
MHDEDGGLSGVVKILTAASATFSIEVLDAVGLR